jgi:quinoprotein glucose dehydrogenase
MNLEKRSICWLALVCMATVLAGRAQKSPDQANWMDYGGGVDALQYSPLQQINKTSVSRLTQAWFYSVPGVSARFSYSPLIVDGRMYVLGSGKTIVCLDAATGKEMWTHPTESTPTDRGINYWES